MFRASFNKEPRPTKLQGDYIAISREYLNQEQAKTARNQRRTVATLSVLLLLVTGLGILAVILGLRARERQQFAEAVQTNAEFVADSLGIGSFLNADYERDAVIKAVQTGQKMQLPQSESLEPDTRWRTLATIQKAVYGANERERMIGHCDAVESVVFSPSPDDPIIATASRDGTVKLWNRQGEVLQTLRGHRGYVLSVAFSPDGETLTLFEQAVAWDSTLTLDPQARAQRLCNCPENNP